MSDSEESNPDHFLGFSDGDLQTQRLNSSVLQEALEQSSVDLFANSQEQDSEVGDNPLAPQEPYDPPPSVNMVDVGQNH